MVHNKKSDYLSLVIAAVCTVLSIITVLFFRNDMKHPGQWVLFGMELLVSAHVFWIWKKKGVCEQTDDLKYIITVYLFLELFSSNLETISLRGLSWKTVPHLYFVLPLFLLSLFYFIWYIRKYYLH